MNEFMTVIDELGGIIQKYKDVIKFKDDEIDDLKRKLEELESLFAFYNHEISEDEYNEIVRNHNSC